MNVFLRFRYWLAQLRSGYGPIRLQTLPEGTIIVSVYSRGRWVPVIADFKDLTEYTVDHSVSELDILAHINRPFYVEREGAGSPNSHRRTQKNPSRRAGR